MGNLRVPKEYQKKMEEEAKKFDKIKKLNSAFVSMRKKEQIIREVAELLKPLSSNEKDKIIGSFFDTINSPKALRAIIRIMPEEIVTFFFNGSENEKRLLNIDCIWEDEIFVNKIFTSADTLVRAFSDRNFPVQLAGTIIEKLNSENRANIINTWKTSNLGEEKFAATIKKIPPSDFLGDIIKNININYIMYLIYDPKKSISLEIKNRIFMLRTNEVIPTLENQNSHNYILIRDYLSSGLGEEVTGLIISKINYSMLVQILNTIEIDEKLNSKVREQILNLRKADVDKYISEKIKEHNEAYADFESLKYIYEPILAEIIKGIDIKVLMTRLRPDIPDNVNRLILQLRKKELSDELEKLEVVEPMLIKYALDNGLITSKKVSDLYQKENIENLALKLMQANFSKEFIIQILKENEGRIYEYIRNCKDISKVINLLLIDMPSEMLNNIITKIDKSILISLLNSEQISKDTKLAIYKNRREEIIGLINENIKTNYSFLIDEKLSIDEIISKLRELGYANLKDIFPLYDIIPLSQINQNEFVLSMDTIKEVYNTIYLDNRYKQLSKEIRIHIEKDSIDVNNRSKKFSNEIITVAEKSIRELPKEEVVDLFFRQLEKKDKEQDTTLLSTIYSIRKEDILDYCSKKHQKYFLLFSILQEDELDDVLSKLTYDELFNIYIEKLYSEAIINHALDQLVKYLNPHGLELGEVIRLIDSDARLFINRSDEILTFLENNLPNINTFFKHALFEDIDWLHLVIDIIDNGKANDFNRICGQLLEKIYGTKEDNLMLIQSFLKVLKNYSKYPELCSSIANLPRELTDEEKLKIEFLFYKGDSLNTGKIPTKIEDIGSVAESVKAKFIELLSIPDIAMKSIEIRNQICTLLLGFSEEKARQMLSIYGNVERLQQLKFINRNNPEVVNLIDEMIIFVSIIEDILDTSGDRLTNLMQNIINNIEAANKISLFFSQFEEKMRRIYELDSQLNLTKIDSAIQNNPELLSEKYGVEIVDFSDREYLLYAHTLGGRENIEEVATGKSSSGKNFISLSPISYRGQKYFGGSNIIFGYDVIPTGNFIFSSTKNMGTSAYIKPGSNKVSPITNRTQKGMLECSDITNGSLNAEAFYFREGIKPSCIIVPQGQNITEKIVQIAKQYGLRIVLTQANDKIIDSPKPLDDKKPVMREESKRVTQLKELKEELFTLKGALKKPRQIAILTDPHALFEPTLAILEDARRHGITEMYSLGDNIGTGPNPGAVVDLLKEYGVSSVRGNHELYTLVGAEPFQGHLKGGAFEEAKRNSTWTRLHLTNEQLEIIKKYPEKIEITIGGKKILLTHFIRDFNSNEVTVDPQNYDAIFQGHVHYSSSEGNTTTVRGAGIGMNGEKPGAAEYIILTEKEGGGYEITTRKVPFDLNNLMHSINTAGMDDADEMKIEDWTEVHAARK